MNNTYRLKAIHHFVRILVDVPRITCLPSLKTLYLRRVALAYNFPPCFERLLSNCPVLEDLVVEGCEDDLQALRVISSSLGRLTLVISIDCYSYGFLEETYIDSIYPNIHKDNNVIKKFITQITSVKRLSLCLAIFGEVIYGDSIVFNQLEYFTRSGSCGKTWSNLLVRLLKDSPKLQELEIYDSYVVRILGCAWRINVPQCLLWSLQTFKWTGINGSQKDIDLVKYILRIASCLKTATILGLSSHDPKKKLDVIEELSLSSRASTSCQLKFFART
ncbi:hypothetical protein EUTSA_v10019482mg [Eutrema salsugineum]|uniref:FBD domain-containing protein n=1 Tax=Eutrema salsugineum TaxID=72664 RepID=V4KMW9_EUTSA|nr:hypothetical protein EUTSA_v10019482mg [Eutrema salsugineum]